MTRSKTRIFSVAAVLLAYAILASGLWAVDRGRVVRPLGPSSLVPVSNLNVPTGTPAGQPLGPGFLPAGSDPLQNGSANLTSNGILHVDLHGASPQQTYSAYFCRFGFGPAGCVQVGQTGGISTDSNGNGHADLDFPASVGSEDWTGQVLITRTIGSATTYEYAGAIHVGINRAAQPSFDLQGQISSITPTTSSFVISPLKDMIVTDSSTTFDGKAHSFSDLMVGMQVDVKGVILSDGTLLATDVNSH
jgi:Domain of unknown function (DUF5666)